MEFIDQLGRTVQLAHPCKRIVSLVPSQTELLADLGLNDEVAGITKFCIHPRAWFEKKPKVGGTKNFRLDVIETLKPDLIIGNKEENYREGIEALEKKYPVWMSDVTDFESALDMIRGVARGTSRSKKGQELIEEIRSSFHHLPVFRPLRTLYLIWSKPWMAAGKDTFVDAMIHTIGLQNAVSASRYPSFSIDEIKLLDPELVLLSSEPYPFKEEHVNQVKALLPKALVLLVDGEPFSWYGSRMKYAPAYFAMLPLPK